MLRTRCTLAKGTAATRSVCVSVRVCVYIRQPEGFTHPRRRRAYIVYIHPAPLSDSGPPLIYWPDKTAASNRAGRDGRSLGRGSFAQKSPSSSFQRCFYDCFGSSALMIHQCDVTWVDKAPSRGRHAFGSTPREDRRAPSKRHFYSPG